MKTSAPAASFLRTTRGLHQYPAFMPLYQTYMRPQRKSQKDPTGCTIVLKIDSNRDSEKDSVNFTANLSETKNKTASPQ